jgi:hypothetical protein
MNKQQEIINFIKENDLYEFLEWLKNEIANIFGNAQQKVELVDYDPLDIHLGIYVYSELSFEPEQDLEQTEKEDALFKRIEEEQKESYLKRIVIGFR